MDGCKAALPLVEKLADGEASPNETREAEAHLALCPDCREHLEALNAFARLSSESGLPEPPESYWEHLPRRILERVEAEAVAPRSFWQKLLAPEMLRLQAIVVSCVLLVAVGVTVLRSGLREAGTPATTPPSAQARVSSVPADPAIPAVTGVPAAEEEKVTPEQTAKLKSLGYLAETPPIARDEPAEATAAGTSDAADAAKSTRAPPPAEPPAPASAAPAPATTGPREMAAEVNVASVVEERASSEDESFRFLKQKEQKEEEPEAHQRSRAAANRALSVDSAEDTEPCAGWRRFLETYGDEGARGGDARYELARCSIRRYEQAPVDASREMAIADAEAFLAREPEGPRAEEIRKALEAIRR